MGFKEKLKKFLTITIKFVFIILSAGLYLVIKKNNRLRKEIGNLKIRNKVHSENDNLNSASLGDIVDAHNEQIRSRDKK